MDSRPYLLLITHDSRVAHQRFDIFLVELCNFGKRELSESFLEIRPLILNHRPVESCRENGLGQSLEILGIVLWRVYAPRRHIICTRVLGYLWAPLFP